ncbi:MarR family transcriptional regulator [Corynebacterium canis]|uniref:MarR family transcriptional regulator n=1 Tax=Corynebacterium canis TaxID=679663 RepID=A0A5C5UAL9_9CORY|nr:MarR family transcriptional regulator [Corynebacterium canis]TWT22883.1 MarR family transcriptional regulator [Corynebacterium canis]WJY76504.1 putative HTH-type transcriptional regulator YusO [Corynebacterium canis]
MSNASPEEIAALIRPSLTQLYVTYFRRADQSDLTGPQLTIMTRLAENGPSRINEVARREGIRMPTASNALHQLEQRGMIERLRDTADRRGVRVRLTALGRTELERVGAERTRYLAEMLSTLEPEQLETISALAPLIQQLAVNYTSATFKDDAKD